MLIGEDADLVRVSEELNSVETMLCCGMDVYIV